MAAARANPVATIIVWFVGSASISQLVSVMGRPRGAGESEQARAEKCRFQGGAPLAVLAAAAAAAVLGGNGANGTEAQPSFADAACHQEGAFALTSRDWMRPPRRDCAATALPPGTRPACLPSARHHDWDCRCLIRELGASCSGWKAQEAQEIEQRTICIKHDMQR